MKNISENIKNDQLLNNKIQKKFIAFDNKQFSLELLW